MYPQPSIQSLRRSSGIEIACELIGPGGKRILDIGCGEGELTRALARAGAEVTGIDPNEGRIERARAKADEEGVTATFEVGIGENLPYADDSFDVAVLSNSLHHVPAARMGATVAEAVRLVAPGGRLFAMEPVPRGPYFEVQSVWNDETKSRALALDALATVLSMGFRPTETVFYRTARRVPDCATYMARAASRHENKREILARKAPLIEEKFDANAEPVDGGFTLDMIYRVNLFQRDP
jgi:2-polyprenyl-3-methyl-5-hydroxy-6-metoxy-1,4-benzoquinol methylase